MVNVVCSNQTGTTKQKCRCGTVVDCASLVMRIHRGFESIQRLNLLIELSKNNLTYDEISHLINRTKQSVRIRLNKLCLNCNKEFVCLKSEQRKFCCHSCSATYNNKLKTKLNYCINRNKEISIRNHYCNNTCKSEYKRKILYQKIENGDFSFDHRRYKKYLIEKHGEQCMECGWKEKNVVTGNIPIELEHIDGNSENNLLTNLKLLCPNCHSLTPTYKALNVGNGRHKRRERYKDGKSY